MTYTLIHYAATYLLIGSIFTLIIDLIITNSNKSQKYTTHEVVIMTILWPVNVLVFIVGFFYGLFFKQ